MSLTVEGHVCFALSCLPWACTLHVLPASLPVFFPVSLPVRARTPHNLHTRVEGMDWITAHTYIARMLFILSLSLSLCPPLSLQPTTCHPHPRPNSTPLRPSNPPFLPCSLAASKPDKLRGVFEGVGLQGKQHPIDLPHLLRPRENSQFPLLWQIEGGVRE